MVNVHYKIYLFISFQIAFHLLSFFFFFLFNYFTNFLNKFVSGRWIFKKHQLYISRKCDISFLMIFMEFYLLFMFWFVSGIIVTIRAQRIYNLYFFLFLSFMLTSFCVKRGPLTWIDSIFNIRKEKTYIDVVQLENKYIYIN